MFKPRYRICRDPFAGYEPQVWRWWFPIWQEAGFWKTFTTVEEAEIWIRGQAREVVKYLGEV
jgi:hypothetical protein